MGQVAAHAGRAQWLRWRLPVLAVVVVLGAASGWLVGGRDDAESARTRRAAVRSALVAPIRAGADAEVIAGVCWTTYVL